MLLLNQQNVVPFKWMYRYFTPYKMANDPHLANLQLRNGKVIGAVFCGVFDPVTGKILVTASRCMKGETFNKNFGRTLAEARAKLIMNDQFRKHMDFVYTDVSDNPYIAFRDICLKVLKADFNFDKLQLRDLSTRTLAA